MMAAMEFAMSREAAPRAGGNDPTSRRRKLALKSGSRTFLVEADHVDWVEAAGNYLVFHAGRERYTVRSTMREMEPWLAASGILRIHKSTFANLDRVRSIEPIHAGDYAVTLVDGTELVLSRTYRARVLAALDFPSENPGGLP
jgi:DNA-binding LytR/AlgR family response regulator